MTEPKKERCGACTDGYITFVTDDGHLSLRTCRKCGGFGYVDVEPMTNEEWLHTLNTEQLAEFLADKCNEVVETVLSDASCIIDDADQDDYWYRQVDIVEWLKQPHTDRE